MKVLALTPRQGLVHLKYLGCTIKKIRIDDGTEEEGKDKKSEKVIKVELKVPVKFPVLKRKGGPRQKR